MLYRRLFLQKQKFLTFSIFNKSNIWEKLYYILKLWVVELLLKLWVVELFLKLWTGELLLKLWAVELATSFH